jgi:hypothetical protein
MVFFKNINSIFFTGLVKFFSTDGLNVKFIIYQHSLNSFGQIKNSLNTLHVFMI